MCACACAYVLMLGLALCSFLNLEENPLLGSLPAAMVDAMPHLSVLRLGYTKLAGQIPEQFANAPNLREIDVTATALKPGPQVGGCSRRLLLP